jgi:uncharacterized protein (TIRG00374 family)
MKKIKENWKLIIGLLIGLTFLYLAFRKVDFSQMLEAFAATNYWYIILSVGVILFSHWLRAWRWRYLLEPIKKVGMGSLFSALIIGYMGNLFLPAHLGEFIRAYVLGRKQQVPASSVFATVVVERIIDAFTLFALMAFTFIVFPFPHWVRTSGYITFAIIVALCIVLILMTKYREQTFSIMEKVTKPVPARITLRINGLLHSFLDGIVPLKKGSHYASVTILSIVIWLCYVYSFQLAFYAFGFAKTYSLPWSAALVLLVITTISLMIPSSPGYIGTYHFLCQLSLALFGVPDSPALTFAIVFHGVNFLPILVLGFIFVSWEGITLRSIQSTAKREATKLG